MLRDLHEQEMTLNTKFKNIRAAELASATRYDNRRPELERQYKVAANLKTKPPFDAYYLHEGHM